MQTRPNTFARPVPPRPRCRPLGWRSGASAPPTMESLSLRHAPTPASETVRLRPQIFDADVVRNETTHGYPNGMKRFLAISILLAAACRPAEPVDKPADKTVDQPALAGHQAEITKWRETRIERLKREDGWLSLTGLSWLKEGENPA